MASVQRTEEVAHSLSDPLTPDEAATIAGVPAYQLRAWSWDRVGPVNVGTRWRPMYREADLVAWVQGRIRDAVRE